MIYPDSVLKENLKLLFRGGGRAGKSLLKLPGGFFHSDGLKTCPGDVGRCPTLTDCAPSGREQILQNNIVDIKP